MKYTVQLEYVRPSYVDLVVEADSIEEACAKAMAAGHEETCWIDEYDSCSPHYVAAIVPGEHDSVYDADSDQLEIPPQFRAGAVIDDAKAVAIDDVAHAAHAGVAGGFMNDAPLTERELATTLAALRFWQREDVYDPDLLNIACNCGGIEPLEPGEIDALCERINR